MVDSTGTNIPLHNFQENDLNTLIAKGTFVDNKLRVIEDRNNLNMFFIFPS